MPENHQQHTEVPRSTRQRTRGSNPAKPKGEDQVWQGYDPFTRVTGAALRRLNKRQNIAATVEDALL